MVACAGVVQRLHRVPVHAALDGAIAEAEAFLQKVYPNDEASPLFLNPFYVKSNMREIVTTQDHSPLPFGPLYVTDSGTSTEGPQQELRKSFVRACLQRW